MSTTLEKELETFRRELPRLLADPANQGKYVLIKGETVAGIYPTMDEAVDAGYARFGLPPFLAKLIVEHEKPVLITHNSVCRY